MKLESIGKKIKQNVGKLYIQNVNHKVYYVKLWNMKIDIVVHNNCICIHVFGNWLLLIGTSNKPWNQMCIIFIKFVTIMFEYV